VIIVGHTRTGPGLGQGNALIAAQARQSVRQRLRESAKVEIAD
jgi:hypothetical protein